MNAKKGLSPQNCSLKISEIRDNVLRLDFYSQSYLEELKQSIEREGLLEPLLVHKNENLKEYTLLNGHYRIRILRRFGFKEVACNVIICDEEQAISNYIASFIRKNSLSALEEGHILSNLVKKGYQLKEISQKWNKSESWVSRRIKLLRELDETVKTGLKNGHIFPRIAQELSRLPQGKGQKRVYELVKKHRLTKDETALLVDRWLIASPKEKLNIEKEFSNLNLLPKKEKQLPEYLKHSMQRCIQSLKTLIDNVNQCEDLEKNWPCEGYFCFSDLINQLQEKLVAKNMLEREGIK